MRISVSESPHSYVTRILCEITHPEIVEMGLGGLLKMFRDKSDGWLHQVAGTADPAWGTKPPIGATTGDFWIVVREDDTRAFRHPTEAAAVKEAERLAAQHPQKRFYVLRPEKVSQADGRATRQVSNHVTSASCASVYIVPHGGDDDRVSVSINNAGQRENNWFRSADLRDMAAFLQREADRIEKPVVRTRSVSPF